METLYAEYVALRAGGMRPADAIETLRERIEVLLPTDKLSLVRAVRAYEEQAVHTVTTHFRPTGNVAPALFDDEPAPGPTIEDLAARAAEEGETTIKLPENLRKQQEARVLSALAAAEDADSETLYTPCPNCGNPVLVSLLQCPTCYFVMPTAGPAVEGSAEAPREAAPEPPVQYYPNSTLVLSSRDGRRVFSKPQDSRREVIIGRTDGKTFTADLDLGPLDAATLGVSRVHAALVYDAVREILCIMDMNSMNGTYLNGLRLKPQELHDLRPGDHLRLGRLSVRVSFEKR